jgi:hypothetical protein
VTDPKKPGRPTLTLKPKGGKLAAPGPQEKPVKAPAPKPPAKPKGPAITPPRGREPYLQRFWMVMRNSGQRPKVRHAALAAAQEEARRIAAQYPVGTSVEVWILECTTIETAPASGRAAS